MSEFRIYFRGERVGSKFARVVRARDTQARAAFRAAAQDAADEILTRGRKDIERAPGNWGRRWPAGLHVAVSEGGGRIRLQISHDVPYFSVFQFGATIHAKNPTGYMWIPLSFARDAQGVSARNFPAPLFRVDRRAGAPLLLSAEDGQPKYFGAESVTIPQKFHVVEIARDVARKMPTIYKRELRKQGG